MDRTAVGRARGLLAHGGKSLRAGVDSEDSHRFDDLFRIVGAAIPAPGGGGRGPTGP